MNCEKQFNNAVWPINLHKKANWNDRVPAFSLWRDFRFLSRRLGGFVSCHGTVYSQESLFWAEGRVVQQMRPQRPTLRATTRPPSVSSIILWHFSFFPTSPFSFLTFSTSSTLSSPTRTLTASFRHPYLLRVIFFVRFFLSKETRRSRAPSRVNKIKRRNNRTKQS